MSKALEIISEISQHAGDIQKLLTRLMCDNCTKTPEQREIAIDAQADLAFWERETLGELRKVFEE